MIVTRRARFRDAEDPAARALVERGMRSVEPEAIFEKVAAQFRALVAGPQHHAAIAFEGETPVAYIGAQRAPTWTPKDRFVVVAWYSEARGAGSMLLEELVARARDEGVGEVLVALDPGKGLSESALERLGAQLSPSFVIKVR